MALPDNGLTQRRRGTNLPKMGDFNQAVILDSIRRSEEGLSRVELAGSAGLAAQTVSNICRRLLDAELIVEAGKESLGPGKPRTILRLNPKGMYAIGVHIDPAMTNFALIDAVGQVLETREITTELDISPADMIAKMSSVILEIVDGADFDTSRLAGVGVATPGPVDALSGTVVAPPHMQGWDRVPLRQWLAEGTGLPVVMDKDVTASAVSELWMGKSTSSSNFIYLYIGTGIGAGLVMGDEVVRGSSGNVGEIGHIVADPNGTVCDCGRRGCVKVSCMPETILAQAREAGVLEAANPHSDHVVPEDLALLVATAKAGNQQASQILSQWAKHMAGVISTLTNFLDVEQVVIGGPFWPAISEIFLEEIPQLVEHYSVTSDVHSLGVTGTRVNSEDQAFGAACLAMESTFSPTATQLLLEAK